MASSGVAVLIPETGESSIDWVADVNQADWRFFTGAWLFILTGFLAIVALVGFHATLRDAGPVLVLAPILGCIGLTLVTVSHLISIAVAYELAPAYAAANGAGQVTLAAALNTLAAVALVTNSAGNFLGCGVAVPAYAFAILATGRLPRWIGWLGLVVGFLAGWLGLVSPFSTVVAAASGIGFIGFFVFMLSMGVAMLIRGRTAPAVETPSVP
jgi:hypothetical protein